MKNKLLIWWAITWLIVIHIVWLIPTILIGWTWYYFKDDIIKKIKFFAFKNTFTINKIKKWLK